MDKRSAELLVASGLNGPRQRRHDVVLSWSRDETIGDATSTSDHDATW
jgi:hypothetical protein